MTTKIILGLSGGVDSSLTASLLTEQGYTVVGVALDMHAHSDVSGARAVCDALGCEFHAVDCRALFDASVADYLADGYASGRTPSPCVVCNRTVKLEALCRFADSLGVERIATGHYATVGHADGRYYVGRAVDEKKDQSYFLALATQEQLSRLTLPLGGYTKPEVREMAASRGIASAEKRDSQEICFLPDGDYAAFVESRRGRFPEGEIIAPDGSVAGRHSGIIRYTVGQRKHLGVALGRPVFVSRIDAAANRIYLSDAGGEFAESATVRAINFVKLTPPERDVTFTAYAKHRAAARPAEVDVEVVYNKSEESYTATLRFRDPARAVTPGQFAVVYDSCGEVLFGGEINFSEE